MRNKLSIYLLCGVILALTVSNALGAGTPSLMNYQGRLTNPTGTPLTGSYSIVFTIYDDPVASSPGNIMWRETHPSVSVADGLFNVILGAGAPAVPLTDLVFSSPNRWLGIRVGADPEISPRTRLTSVPYSFRVGTVDGASGGTIEGDLTVVDKVHASAYSSNSPLRFEAPSGVERARIDDVTGNFGIGTTVPLAGLHVECNSVLKYALKIDNLATQPCGAEITGGAKSATPLLNVHGPYGSIGGDGQGLWVQSDGKVGIGTIAPTEKLHVDSGNVLVEGIGSFNDVGDEARVFLGDNSHYIRSIHGSGVRIGTFGVGDAVTILQSSGHVGVGTTNPTNPSFWQKILQVYNPVHAAISVKNSNKQYDIGAVSGGGLGFVDATAGNTIMRFDPNGKVGIGTTTPNSTLHIDGSLAKAFKSVAAAYTVTASDCIVAVSSSVAISLPTASQIAGRTYTIKNTAPVGAVTVSPILWETVDGVPVTIVLLNQWNYITIVSDGTGWLVIGRG